MRLTEVEIELDNVHFHVLGTTNAACEPFLLRHCCRLRDRSLHLCFFLTPDLSSIFSAKVLQ